MTAPVNPEGQTAREHELKCWPEFFEKLLSREKTFEARKDDRGFRAGDRLRLREWGEKRGYTGREILADVTYLMTGFGVAPGYVVMAIRPLAQPSEGQTAQELRQRAEALWIALNRPAMTSNKGIDLIVRALASTPSQIQTQSTKEQNNGAGRIHEGGGEGHGGGSQGGVRGASESEEDGLRRPHERHLPVPDGSGERRALGAAEEEVAPPPAKQTEQKIADQKGGGADEARSPVADGGAASQLGAAPATSPGSELHGLIVGGSVKADPAYSAAAQPDARDAEIARLKEELEAATATIEDEQAAHEETRADAARLTKELEEEARQYIRDNESASIAAETAGQKEGRTTCRATVDFDPLEMCEPIECGNPMPCALHPAQPSQDVAGTSSESLAGLSKEGSET